MSRRPGLAATWLYVPGHRERLLTGAVGRGADAVIADLEDAVPPALHDDARALVAGWLQEREAGTGPLIAVRVGARDLDDDLDAVVGSTLDAVVLAKAEPALLDRADRRLAALERARGLTPGAVRVVALLESAVGILDARQIAAHPRVALLAIGEADLTAELAITPSVDDRELLALRTQVLLGAAAAGLPAPMGPVCTELTDLDRLGQVSRAVLAQGFGSLAAIHPAQVPVLAQALQPTAEAVAHARAVLDALDAADGGAAIGPDGRMVDEAVARHARGVVERGTRAG